MKINIKNVDKIQAAIDQVQKHARVRTIEYYNVTCACNAVANKLNITKKAMHGVTFTADCNAETFKGSYKGIPESTIITCEYSNGNWYLVDVKRARTFAKTIKYQVKLTEAAKTEIINNCKWFD